MIQTHKFCPFTSTNVEPGTKKAAAQSHRINLLSLNHMNTIQEIIHTQTQVETLASYLVDIQSTVLRSMSTAVSISELQKRKYI